MRIVMVTGMSGGGKSVALRALEDAGFYAIDNLPIPLLNQLIELLAETHGEVQKLALVVDTRDAQHLAEVPGLLAEARAKGHEVDLIFLDASDEALERRFSETRRRHPLGNNTTVREAIAQDRLLLEPLREEARLSFDTSSLSTHELKREIQRRVIDAGTMPMSVTLVSFGYRLGLPSEADLVFDVRFLPNPFFVDHLRALSGEDAACAAFVLERPETQALLGHLRTLLDFLLPQFDHEGKAYLTIAVGCTGGQHRSVAIVRWLADWLREQQGREVRVRHRDMRASMQRPGSGT